MAAKESGKPSQCLHCLQKALLHCAMAPSSLCQVHLAICTKCTWQPAPSAPGNLDQPHLAGLHPCTWQARGVLGAIRCGWVHLGAIGTKLGATDARTHPLHLLAPDDPNAPGKCAKLHLFMPKLHLNRTWETDARTHPLHLICTHLHLELGPRTWLAPGVCLGAPKCAWCAPNARLSCI